MKIFAKWGEVTQDITLTYVNDYDLKNLISSRQFKVQVIQCRDLPQDSYYRKEKIPYGFHKVILTQNIAGRVMLKLCSRRLSEKEIVELGLESIPTATAKEKHIVIRSKLVGSC